MPAYEAAILASELPAQKICVMNDDDPIRAYIIEQIMCYMSVDLSNIRQKFALKHDYFDTAIKHLQPYQDQGFIDITVNDYIQIKPEAKPITRLVAAAFDAYYSGSFETPRHAKAI